MYICQYCGKRFSSNKLLTLHQEKICQGDGNMPRTINKIIIDARNGDEDCKVFLIERYEPMILNTIKTFEEQFNVKFNEYDVEDLKQQGAIGVINCINKDVDFSHNVFWYIKNSIYDYAITLFNIPHYMIDKFSNDEIKKLIEQRSVDFIDVDTVDYGYDYSNDYESYAFYSDLLDNIKDVLSKKEQTIIFDRYIKEQTLEQVGKKLGISRERVRQIENRALNKLSLDPRTRRFKISEKTNLSLTEAQKNKAIVKEKIDICEKLLHDETNKYTSLIYGKNPLWFSEDKKNKYLGYWYNVDYRAYEVYTINKGKARTLIRVLSAKKALEIMEIILSKPYMDELDVVLDL